MCRTDVVQYVKLYCTSDVGGEDSPKQLTRHPTNNYLRIFQIMRDLDGTNMIPSIPSCVSQGLELLRGLLDHHCCDATTTSKKYSHEEF